MVRSTVANERLGRTHNVTYQTNLPINDEP